MRFGKKEPTGIARFTAADAMRNSALRKINSVRNSIIVTTIDRMSI
jgi:hypothetical protein